jgi:hypothetical protein
MRYCYQYVGTTHRWLRAHEKNMGRHWRFDRKDRRCGLLKYRLCRTDFVLRLSQILFLVHFEPPRTAPLNDWNAPYGAEFDQHSIPYKVGASGPLTYVLNLDHPTFWT